MKTKTIPTLHTPKIDHRTGLLKAINGGAMRVMPFNDRAVFGPEVAQGIRHAEHFGMFDSADALMAVDFGRPCYTRDHGLMADEGLVEIGGKSPVIFYFKRLGEEPSMEALMFQGDGYTWLGTPTIELHAHQQSVRIRRNGEAPQTPLVGVLLTRIMHLASQTLLTLGHHLRARN